MNEKKWKKRFVNRWNERFKEYAGGYVGRANVENMLNCFLKAYKRREGKRYYPPQG